MTMPNRSHDGFTVADFDHEGAVAETAAKAEQVTGGTRAGFLRKSGALAGAGLVAGSIPVGLSFAQGSAPPASDIAILNYALTLEYLESSFYNEAVSRGKLSGATADFAKLVAQHEAAHVQALQKVLGSKAVKKPTFDFKGTTEAQSTFQKTAMTLEDVGVTAYEGQAPKIKTPAILAAAGSILPVEARHASWIRDIIGHGSNPVPAPDAFNPAASMSQVLSEVKATGFIKS
jgi:rubrerythrin